MKSRPAVGSLGRALNRLAPSGQAEILGVAFPARTAGETIDAGRDILVTGFDPFELLVREATPADLAPAPPPPTLGGSKPYWAWLLMAALIVLAGCFGLLTVYQAALTAKEAFRVGPEAVVGWLVVLLGEVAVAVVLLALAELLRLVSGQGPPMPRRRPAEQGADEARAPNKSLQQTGPA
jgi:hypothetical protein